MHVYIRQANQVQSQSHGTKLCLTGQFTDEEPISCADKESCEDLGRVEHQGRYQNIM